MRKLKVEVLEKTIKSKQYDYIFYMNNSTGVVKTSVQKKMSELFKDTFADSIACNNKALSLVDTFQSPVKERYVKKVFLNVHTRVCESNMSNRDQIKSLRYALRNIAQCLLNENILIVVTGDVVEKDLKQFISLGLAGNNVSYIVA